MSKIPATCELWIDGVHYPDGHAGESLTDPFALSDLTVSWGRDNTIDQPEPATCTFTIGDPPSGDIRFDETVAIGSTVLVWSELDGTRVVVFSGRVTDLTASYDESAGHASCEVIAADQLAELASRYVGDEPWPQEVLWQRAQRISTAATGVDLIAYIGGDMAWWNVSRMDVDRQSGADLLTELAISGGAVLWCGYDPSTSRPYIWLEDPGLRASLYVFSQGIPSLLWAPAPGLSAGTPLSACEVLQDPTEWARSVTDFISRVTVRWLDPAGTPDPTERTYAIVDAGAESAYGARGLSVGTILTDEATASSLGTAILAAHRASPSWRTSGLTWNLSQVADDNAETRGLALTLLDNRSRLGYAVALVDLPYWTPTAAAVQLYIEGGQYTFDDGYWTLALIGAPASGLGSSLTYGQTDLSIRYVDVDPAVTFVDMVGVGPAGKVGPAWDDLAGPWTDLTGNWSELE